MTPFAGTPDLSPSTTFAHQLHSLIAPLERLLNDRANDRALLDAAEHDRILVEADDLDLPQLAFFLQHFIDARRVVGIKADQATDIGIGGERVLDIPLGARGIDLIGAHVDQLHFGALDRFLEAIDALARVVCARKSDVGI